MSKYINALLVFLYVVLGIFCFLLVLVIAGVGMSDRTGFLIMIGWVIFCFCSAYLFSGWRLLFGGRLRKPTVSEERRLGAAFEEVRRRADGRQSACGVQRGTGYSRNFKLRIDETEGWNAFATGTRTIVVSKRLLAGMTEEELKGVLAHELGHLSSGDTVIGAAYVTAGVLPRVAGYLFRLVMAIFLSGFGSRQRVRTNRGVVVVRRGNLLAGLFWFVVLLAVVAYFHLMNGLVALVLFVLLFSLLHVIMRPLTLLMARLAEYRQDAFAHELGFGPGLRQALERLADQDEQTVSFYFIVFHSTHPVIYNRMRRLEKLEEMRDSEIGETEESFL
ncbi:MAG: M48 family metalloprotease [Bacteroidetes bacterium]|nr:M48 family metalloprotease [Bacteroidota bacterium]